MRTLLTPPVFDDEDKTLEARLLHVILLALFGVTAATYLTPLFVSDLVLTLPMLFELLTACLGLIGGLLFLMRRGYVRLTSQILVGLFWITMTILIVLTGGVRAPAYFGYPVAVALCGLLLSGRASILLTALSVVAGFAILTGANRDVLASLSVIPDTPVLWFSASVYLILLAVLQFLATRAMRVALKRARASEAQYRMLFEEAPYGICIADFKNRIQNVNSWAVTMLGYPLEEVIGRVTADFIAPEDLLRMPAASPDEIKAQPSLEWERSLVHKDGRRVSVMISSRYMPDDRFQYIMRDITERKQAEASIRQREAILEAVAFAAEKFLRTSDWRANIETVLEKLGQRIGASHAYLFENHLAPDGTPLTSIRYEWSAPGIPSDLEAPEFQNSLIYEPGFEQWAENLSRGEPFYGSHKSLPPAEVDQLVRRGIKSLLDMPIYVGEGWWGIIGFDDLVAVREWSAAEVDALKAAASIIGAAIQRERVDTVLRQSEALYRRAIEAAGAVPYYRDWRADTYTFMGEGIAQITSYSAAEMTPTLWDSLEEEASPRGELAGLSHPEAQSRVRSGQVHQWECDYRIRTRDGQSRWVADSSVQVRDEHGVRIGVIGILQDITERKQ
ncbi:MAG TPA: PAS domain S-box protein, partial [Anaerolineales bacterium]|nr:PAS domain S-box protein [Anaerolineales bacterium]